MPWHALISPGKRVCLHRMESDIPDENLMLSYGQGDADAFEVLYRRHKGPLYRYVMRQCGPQYADELYQDIWLNVINARQAYAVKAGFRTWLYRIARNRIIDHYRRQRIRAVETAPGTLSQLTGPAQNEPENRLESGKRQELLMNAIQALPRDQKEAFLLKEEAGLSVREIAQTTGVTFEAAKSRLRYAFDRLKAQLETSHEH